LYQSNGIVSMRELVIDNFQKFCCVLGHVSFPHCRPGVGCAPSLCFRAKNYCCDPTHDFWQFSECLLWLTGTRFELNISCSPFLVQSFFETVHYCDEWENSHLSYIRYHRVNFPGGVYDLSSWWFIVLSQCFEGYSCNFSCLIKILILSLLPSSQKFPGIVVVIVNFCQFYNIRFSVLCEGHALSSCRSRWRDDARKGRHCRQCCFQIINIFIEVNIE
jgi:hypothetical protein